MRDPRGDVGPLLALEDLDVVAARPQLFDDGVGDRALVVGSDHDFHPNSVAYSEK
jgi:hypothetical protein